VKWVSLEQVLEIINDERIDIGLAVARGEMDAAAIKTWLDNHVEKIVQRKNSKSTTPLQAAGYVVLVRY
jgi:biotin synthase-related radical SAM superfamily protein